MYIVAVIIKPCKCNICRFWHFPKSNNSIVYPAYYDKTP